MSSEDSSIAAQAKALGLHRVGGRPPFFRYLAQTWARREFIWNMAKFRLVSTFTENRLGMAWLVLQPVFNAIVYGLIFGVLQGDARPPDYPARVVIGVFFFQFFRGCFNRGARSIINQRNLVQSLAFPRVTLPVAIVLEELLSALPSWGMLVVILPVMGHWPSVEWLLIVPVIILSTLFNAGVALIAARITVHLQDMTEIIPLVTRILFFTSGVLFDVGRIFDRWPWIVTIYDFHPIYQMVQLARSALMGIEVDPLYWLYFSGFALVFFIVGLRFFWSAEERYGR
ncbi:MAG: ABC transporter permease [Propionibacteriaceae bacterium]|jgi:teichoic acid transport system permease protein|nr:ABC transporter permease [Propionibacteriaceae bacterium]